MGEIVNLTRARKQRARERVAEQAQQMRVRFGRTKTARQRDAHEAAARAALLDGKRREDAADDPKPD